MHRLFHSLACKGPALLHFGGALSIIQVQLPRSHSSCAPKVNATTTDSEVSTPTRRKLTRKPSEEQAGEFSRKFMKKDALPGVASSLLPKEPCKKESALGMFGCKKRVELPHSNKTILEDISAVPESAVNPKMQYQCDFCGKSFKKSNGKESHLSCYKPCRLKREESECRTSIRNSSQS